MARIPENEVERLKREISVQRLAEARGIKLTRQGANLLGKCPFHDDKTPSLVITPAKNLWHCMGACSMGGTAIDWVMKAEGISFRHAVELLRKDDVPLAASPIQPVKKSTVPKLPAPLTAEAGDRELLLEVVGFYQAALTGSPEAMRYLESRGLRSAEMVERFRLGFANRTLGYGLEAKNRAGGAAVRGRLQRLGVYRESGHEHFNGSLVIPVINPAGDVMEMYGRKITPNLREGTPNHLYLPGEHRGVWNEESLIASKDVILCEALIDALTFWCAGYRNVTASYGTNGFTADHRAAFEKHGTRRVYIAYDRDEAGDKAAAKLADELIEMGIDCYPLKLLQSEGEVSIASTGKDPVSGRHITHEYRVKGPVMIFLTTTSPDVDEELLNRCLVLSVNEDREQTQAIHRVQRESQTLDGLLLKRKRDAVLKLHRNAQRLLRPVQVVNDLAVGLSFPDSMTRMRRDHMKFLTLIRAIAFLHQWQREVKTATDEEGKPFEYIEAIEADVELAKKLIHDVLGRSLDDMQGQTRRLLLLVDAMVTAECKRQKIERTDYRFSRRDVRAFTSWSDSQLKNHLARLQDMEYLIVHRGGRGQSFVYELFFEQPADEKQPTLPGMEHGYDAKKSGLEGQKSGGGLGQVRGVSGGDVSERSPVSIRLPVPFYEDRLKNTTKEEEEESPVVAVPSRPNGSMNGAGHAPLYASGSARGK